MRRILRSRLAIAIAASVLTITAIGGVTYATSTTSGDTYYACAAVNGMIRASWIRLNTAPDKCPISTDHIVQWAAGGQPISPKAGIVIPLDGPVSITRPAGLGDSPTVEWPAVDTSMCRSLTAFIKYSGQSGTGNGEALVLGSRDALPNDATSYSANYGLNDGLNVSLNTSQGGAFSGSARATFAAPTGVIGPRTILTGRVTFNYASWNSPGLTVSIDNASFYCTPY